MRTVTVASVVALCAFSFVSQPAFAATGIGLYGGNLHLVVTNDGNSPAHFTVASADGSQIFARLQSKDSGYTDLAVNLTFFGTLSGDAAYGNFGGFVDYTEESVADLTFEITALDGRVVYSTENSFEGRLFQSRNLFFPNSPFTNAIRASSNGGGFATDFLEELGVESAIYHPTRLYIGTGPAQFLGIEGSSVSGFDLAVTSFSVDMSVPEPTTWALMILGFGAVGGTARRRRRLIEKSSWGTVA